MSPAFGIDFGTSNSALAASVDNQVKLLDIDPGNPLSNSLKSILYFIKEDGRTHSFVGYEGVRQYIDNGAEGRYMQSIKSFLSDLSFQKTNIYGKNYTLEELIAHLLRVMKTRGEKIIGQEVDTVVLGRPVVFSTDAERENTATRRLINAAQLAGFKEISLQMEPVAAARAYENSLPCNREQIVLVGDFGAGSSDFTVLKVGNSHHRVSRAQGILSVGGLYIGGDNFDSLIMRHKVARYYGTDVQVKSMFSDNLTGLSPLVLSHLMQWHRIPWLRRPQTLGNIKELKVGAGLRDRRLLENLERLISDNYGYLLFQSIETAKCRLSDHGDATVNFKDYGIAIEEPVTRIEFEDMIRDLVLQIDACVTQTLADAGIAPEQVNAVFLTGGSSYIPLIRAIFEFRVGADKIKTADAFTSVAYGLGLEAGLLA
ncbi:Hsp70 family protein [uncultured Desulfobacter sp.]|uniref:Hsp70 family protein n=1 Tax=uncultured Desulfobacter sp. TaxID=240139 RepID=UPI002AABD1F5|nr:Hsp70 family protein [uncultured Desulfobacter sp.]